MSSRTDTPADLISLLRDEREAEDFKIDGADLSGEDFHGCIIRSSVITSSDFHDVSFWGGAFSDVVFDGCDLSAADLSGCFLSSVTFRSSKLTGIRLPGCRIRKLFIIDSVCRYASFERSSITDSVFSGSVFESASFSEVRATSSRIVSSDLPKVSCRGTTLSGFDLADSIIEGIYLSDDLSELRGASLSFDQALSVIRDRGVLLR